MRPGLQPVGPILAQREAYVDILCSCQIGDAYIDLSIHLFNTYTRSKVNAAPPLNPNLTPRDDRTQSLPHNVFLASNGGTVSWQSRKQSLIAMSTLEAEFIACSEASREAKWLPQLQKDIHGKDLPPLPINCDNQGALTLITTGIIKARTKHIDVCYHNSRDLHKCRIVNYSYVHTDENVADILTKALTKDKHMKFTKAIGLW
jgi:hypothetical protein